MTAETDSNPLPARSRHQFSTTSGTVPAGRLLAAMSLGLLLCQGLHAQTCDTYELVPSPNAGSDANVLRGIAAIDANDAWAVGYFRSGANALPLSLHWTGSVWQTVAMPTPPSGTTGPAVTLYDAIAFSPDDVWAVGSNPPASTGSAALETLVYHYNGSAWSIVPSHAGCCGSFGSQFYCVDGVSGNDFWAVGYRAGPVVANPFAAHWNGSNWEEHDLPTSTGSVQSLKDLHVIASDDIWALEASGLSQPNAPRRIFHWDGSSWSIGAPAINAVQYVAAEAIHAFGPGDIWVSSVRGSGGQIVMLHWNGSSWAEMNVPVFASEFFGDAPNDFYAVGRTQIMHWNGSAWTIAHAFSTVPMGNAFDAELTADGTLWSCGNTEPGAGSRTLTARLMACAPCVVDLNDSGGADVPDVFAFLSAWFAGSAAADFDGNGTVAVPDIFSFLSAWFAGC